MLVSCILSCLQFGIDMHTELAITLTPKLSTIVPEVFISVPGKSIHAALHSTQRFELEFDSCQGWIEVEFANKPGNDVELAVIVDKVEFFGISNPKFVWAGVYTPDYPEPWYSEQIEKPPVHLSQQSYMGWNGTWRLEFSVPVFTWMHRTLDFGWIYQ